jgi:hypothetical protein
VRFMIPAGAGVPTPSFHSSRAANDYRHNWFRRGPARSAKPRKAGYLPPPGARTGGQRGTVKYGQSAQPTARHCTPLPRWLYGRRLYRYSTDRTGPLGGLRVALRAC